MAIPSLPAALNTGDVVGNTWVDGVRDGLELARDTRPMLRVTVVQNIPNATNTSIDFSDGAATAAWTTAPAYNVGGWVPKDSNAAAECPETGVYLVTIQGRFSASTTGYRGVELLDGGTAETTIRARVGTIGASAETVIAASGLRQLTAADYITIQAFQNSGGTVNGCAFTMTATWINSTGS